MDKDLSTKVQFLTTVYRLLLHLLVGVLYVGKVVSAIIEFLATFCKTCFTKAIISTGRELVDSKPYKQYPSEQQ